MWWRRLENFVECIQYSDTAVVDLVAWGARFVREIDLALHHSGRYIMSSQNEVRDEKGDLYCG